MRSKKVGRGQKALICCGILLLFLLEWMALSHAALRPPATVPEYRLHIAVDIPQGKIQGRATIVAPSRRQLIIQPGELVVREVRHQGRKLPVRPGKGGEIVLTPRGPVEIIYEVDVKKTEDNFMGPDGVFLLGTWYPVVEGFCRFQVTARVPAGYLAVSEAERLTVKDLGSQQEFVFDFPHPLHADDGVTLAVSNRWSVSQATHNGVSLATYLFPEQAHLADRYLDRIKQVLAKYEMLLNPYPYRRLAIVENSQEVTQALPTYILIDTEDLKPDDLDRTPLDHEILHQWLGCAVSANLARGNWFEGLTIYLADHLLMEEKGRDWQCRRRILSGFQNYMQRQPEFPLRDFTERFDKHSRVIGYGKGAMVIHMLRRQVGDQAFFDAVRLFTNRNLYTCASWEDLQSSFEDTSRQNLAWFFRQWVDGIGQPEIKISEVTVNKAGQRIVVNLELTQTGRIKRLNIPVTFLGPDGKQTFPVVLKQRQKHFRFSLDFSPEEVVLDANYDTFRMLTTQENLPTLERLLTSQSVLVLPPNDQKPYQKALQKFTSQGARIKEHVTETNARSASVIILGRENPAAPSWLSEVESSACPNSLVIRPNPRHPQHLVGIFHTDNNQDTSNFLKEIFAYPFYSTYCWQEEGKVTRTLATSQQGIRLQLPQPWKR